MLALAIRFERPVRGRLVALAAFLGVAGLIAVVVLWNHQTGMIGQIERPFHTLVGDVTPRDYSSNMYRIAEDFNIKFTWRQSVLYGVGFGSPMTVVFPMADISYLYPLWNVIPHNSVLWILMRMGVVGFVAFWGLIGVALGRAVEVVRLHADLLTVCLATAIVAVIGMEIIVGYTDVQWENYRNLIFFGVALGIIEPMRRLAMKAPAARSEEAA